MSKSTALIVGEQSVSTMELNNALQLGGFDTMVATPEEVVTWQEQDVHADTLLVSAELGLHRIALLSERFAIPGQPLTTVVFPEDDMAALETCVRAGFDYVTRPFAPSLLRTRLTTCWERGQLTMAVEEMATTASLHSYERDLAIAHEIQESGFLPDVLPRPAGWEVDARFHPARIVAGDFYDAFELVGGRRLALVIGDVCDKGVGAALFMALIRTMLRHTAEQAGGWDMPGDGLPRPEAQAESPLRPSLSAGAGPLLAAVTGTNSYMARHHRRQGYFCTLFFGILDPVSGTLVYINGGHNPAILVRAEGGHTLLLPTGPAVGMFANSSYLLGQASLAPGDWLFMYTDGVTESRNLGGEFFGMQRTLDVVTQQGRTATELLEAVDRMLRRYTGAAEQHDDITMLSLRRTPRQLPPARLARPAREASEG
jgi:sigma-B regulation protein RsbU (phosphoserine phosphatase)